MSLYTLKVVESGAIFNVFDTEKDAELYLNKNRLKFNFEITIVVLPDEALFVISPILND